jgi:hypothetical protein
MDNLIKGACLSKLCTVTNLSVSEETLQVRKERDGEIYGQRAYIKIIRKPSKRRDQYHSIQWNSENFVVNIFWRAVPASHCIDIHIYIN